MLYEKFIFTQKAKKMQNYTVNIFLIWQHNQIYDIKYRSVNFLFNFCVTILKN